MLKFPRGLGIVQSWRIPCELELIHHRLRATLLPLEQKRHVNFELNEFCRLIFVASWRLFIQRFETLPRLRVVFLLKWNLREVILRLTEFRIQLGCLFECRFGFLKLLLLHQNLATQIEGRRLIRFRLIRFID